MEEAMTLARQIAQGPASVHFAKRAMYHASQLSLKEALTKDSEIYGEVYKTKDFKEGVTAFLEKRKPGFTNE
jgi:enoyl-CoA hydratase